MHPVVSGMPAYIRPTRSSFLTKSGPVAGGMAMAIEKCQFDTEKCQFDTEKCQFDTEKCQLDTYPRSLACSFDSCSPSTAGSDPSLACGVGRENTPGEIDMVTARRVLQSLFPSLVCGV